MNNIDMNLSEHHLRTMAQLLIAVAWWAVTLTGTELGLHGDLNAFCRGLAHVPGNGMGRSSSQVMAEGAGNASELTHACYEALTAKGYRCRVVFGRVALSPSQAAAWTALPPETLHGIWGGVNAPESNENGGLDVDLTWLRVLATDLAGQGVADANSGIWVDVFPALIGRERDNAGGWEPPADAVGRLADGLSLVSELTPWGEVANGTIRIRRFPSALLRDFLDSIDLQRDESAADDLRGVWWRVAMPGYGCLSCLPPAPVAVLREYRVADKFPDSHWAQIDISLSDASGELLRWRVPQAELGQVVLSLRWQAPDGAGEDAAQAGCVPALFRVGGCVAQATRVSVEDDLVLSFSRYANTEDSTLTDLARFELQAGRECRCVLSTGTMAPPTAAVEDDDVVDQLLRHIAFLRDRQCRLATAMLDCGDGAAMRPVVLQQATTTTAPAPAAAAVWQLLLQQEDRGVHAASAATTTGSVLQRHWAMARGLAPALALEWLALSPGVGSVHSPLSFFQDAFRANRAWLWQPAAALQDDAAAILSTTEWLGPDDVGENGLPTAFCAWGRPNADGRAFMLTFDGEHRPDAVIGGLPDALDDMPELCNPDRLRRYTSAYTSALAGSRALAAAWPPASPRILTDMACLSMLLNAVADATDAPRILSLGCPAYWSKTRGDFPIQFELVNASGWSLRIVNAAGELLWRESGSALSGEVAWPLTDFRQQACTDGRYLLSFNAFHGSGMDSVEHVLELDSQAPELALAVETVGATQRVRYAITEAALANAQVTLLDENGAECQRWPDLQQRPAGEITLDRVHPGAGGYLLTMSATDQAGNSCQRQLPLLLEQVPAELPALRLECVGYEQAEPILQAGTTIAVYAHAVAELQECVVLLDGEWLLAAGPGPVLTCFLYPSEWPEGRHELQACAWNQQGEDVVSESLFCFFCHAEEDDMPPLLTVELNQWPPDEHTTLTIGASDNRDLAALQLWQNGTLCREMTFPPETGIGRLEAETLSPAVLAQGLVALAIDRSGNRSQHEIVYPALDDGDKPLLSFFSPQLANGPLTGDVEYILTLESRAALAYLAMTLNGETVDCQYFPAETVFTGVIPLSGFKPGDNCLAVQATGANGRLSDVVTAHFTLPMIMEMTLAPELVQAWAGDELTVSLSAWLRQDCAWTASVPAAPEIVSQSGRGSEVQWAFSSAGLKDGVYQVRVDLPEWSLWREISLLVDHVRGEPIAHISQPATGVLQEAILSVQGTAAASAECRSLSYRLDLCDERGDALIFCPRDNDPRCASLLPARARQAAESERRLSLNQAVSGGELALLDLSGLADGRYVLRLEVVADGQHAQDDVAFQLASELKSGPFSWQERDLHVAVGVMEVNVTRAYASDRQQTSDLGPGWALNLSSMDAVIDEERADLIDVFGSPMSIRQGGSRDVSVTLPDGRRVTFVHELTPGGGLSFCYVARWQPPPGVAATLAPTVSNKLMTLPGLEPYWEAAGMSTPWEMFDFPAFVLTDRDGSQFLLQRDFLGDAELLLGAPDGSDDGSSYAYVAAYGCLQMRQMTTPDGQQFTFADDVVRHSSVDGRMKDILKIERGHESDKRITAVEALAAPGIRMEYAYDEAGRLSHAWRQCAGEARQLRRSYHYDNPLFPNHLTAIRDSGGALLFANRYDALGRLAGTTNAEGAETSFLRDSIAGFELRTDPLGHETTYLHDARGKITAVIAPDGGLTSYEYDAGGKECAVTNQLGEKRLNKYDASGRLLARVEPMGQQTSYSYDASGVCTRVVDPLGHCTDYELNAQGRTTAMLTASGDGISLRYDNQGRLACFTDGEKSQTVLVSYDDSGRVEALTDMLGVQIAHDYDATNQLTMSTLSYFSDDSSETTELSSVTEYDGQGRVIKKVDSLNHWQEMTYDNHGRLARQQFSTGQVLNQRYDAMGRLVERWDSDGLLWRFLYDAGGRQILAAGPFCLPENQRQEPPTLVIFAQAERRYYDACDRLSSQDQLGETALLCEAVGDGHYRCRLLAAGNSLASVHKEYDAVGRIKKMVSATGVERRYDYDANGRCIARLDGLGRGFQWEYDDSGQISAVVDSLGGRLSTVYDERGLPMKLVDSAGAKTLCDYDAQGRLLRLEEPSGLVTENDYNPAGRLSTQRLHRGDAEAKDDQEEGASALYQFAYSPTLNVSAIVDPLGRRSEFVYDELGRPCRQRLPLGQEQLLSYDGIIATPSSRVDYLGNSEQRRYDYHGRVQERRLVAAGDPATGTIYRYQYDATGQLLAITQAASEEDIPDICMAWAYDANGRLIRQESGGAVLQRAFDADGRLTRQWTALTDLRYAYDAGGLLDTICVHQAGGRELDQTDVYSFAYDAAGRLQQISRPDASITRYELDARGLIRRLNQVDKNNSQRCEAQYGYDQAGRCTQALESWRDDGALARERRRRYAYDALGRLRSEESWCEGLAACCYANAFEYDAAGNRVLCAQTDERGAMTIRRCRFDDNDRLLAEEVQTPAETYPVTYTWDANGSLLTQTTGGRFPEERSYFWDAANRLIAVHLDQPWQASGALCWSTYYEYDAQGLLCGTTRERRQNQRCERSRWRLVWTPQEPGAPPTLLDVEQLEGRPELSSHSFVQAGPILAAYVGDGTRWQFGCDRQGAVTQAWAETMMDQQAFDANGNPLLATDEDARHGFTGEWQDPVTGLIYLRSRFYSPAMGVFISRDDHPGRITEARSLHTFSYCLNDPVNRSDPMGSFSMLGTLSTMMTYMGNGYHHFMKYREPVQIATELTWMQYSVWDFMLREAEKDNATVIVHGMVAHLPGYSKGLTDGLDQRSDNQDYYEFLWSGFSTVVVPWIPNLIQHGIAKLSLRASMLSVYQKGYHNINAISHSWGTVLSMGALNLGGMPINTWVTMGSPLPRITPRFAYQHWLNVFSPSDPVVYAGMFLPTLGLSETSEPLYTQESPPDQFSVGQHGFDAHTCYWTNVMTTSLIAQLLRTQK